MDWDTTLDIQPLDDQGLDLQDDTELPQGTEPDCRALCDALINVAVEVRLRDNSTAEAKAIKQDVERFILDRGCITYTDGPLDGDPLDLPPSLQQHVQQMTIVDTNPASYRIGGLLMSWQFQLVVYVYQAQDEEPGDDDEGEEGVPSYKEWLLPHAQLEGLWSTLHYDSCIKQRLLRFASSALLFGERQVDPNLVSWNRVVLLHGPPGTGKTSLCKALAQKLAIRFSDRFRAASLVEVNAHSLFSKWFSESGKQVSKLFTKISELLDEPDVLVFVLIDEIESLAAARKASGGSEPSDAVRAVNALLTQLDQLKRFPNAMVLTTSNITAAIDVAFVDRADIKAYIGPPTLAARYEMLRSSLIELGRTGVVQGDTLPLLWPVSKLQHHVLAISTPTPRATTTTQPAAASNQHVPHQQPSSHITASKAGVAGDAVKAPSTAQSNAREITPFSPAATTSTGALISDTLAAHKLSVEPQAHGVQLLLSQTPDDDELPALSLSGALLVVAHACEGLSGRNLRKLPFLAHAMHECLPLPCAPLVYISALHTAAQAELDDRQSLGREG